MSWEILRALSLSGAMVAGIIALILGILILSPSQHKERRRD